MQRQHLQRHIVHQEFPVGSGFDSAERTCLIAILQEWNKDAIVEDGNFLFSLPKAECPTIDYIQDLNRLL
jgi:hypothetical protein